MRVVEAEGTTVEEAIDNALQELGTGRDRVTVEVLEEGTRGLFGFLGQRPARIRATRRRTKAEVAEEFLTTLVSKLGVDASVQCKGEEDGIVSFNLTGKNLGLIIGYHGQTLNAVQYLANVAVATVSDERKRIMVDVEGYRERRQRTLERLAYRLARKAQRTGRRVELEPMVPHERKLIHTTLADNRRVRTHSEGEDPNRRVIISPTR